MGEVEDLLAERGIIVSYETIRKWVSKFGKRYANAIRRDRPTSSDKLGSYSAALKDLAPNIDDHRSHKGLNNRSEGSHRPTRK